MPAAAVVRDVAQQLKIPRGTVKLALLAMMHSGAVRLGETYEVTLADH
jgi:DNA-binding IclR family transcriptional regulator